MSFKNIVVTDVDGCLTDYPRVFLSWVSEFKGLSFDSLEAMKASMSVDEYEALKHAYRTSGIKRSLPVFAGAREALEELKKQGVDIWVVTTRPGWEPVLSDTKYWLNVNSLPYDELFFVDGKPGLIDFIRENSNQGIRAVIDDSYEVAEPIFSGLGIPVLYFNTQKRAVTNKKIVNVNSWKEIQDYFRNSLLSVKLDYGQS